VRVMEMANWHTYQVLTKRADRMCEMLQGRLSFAASLKHIWWGVSVEDKRYGVPRIELLRQAPSGLRFLSVEPLIEDIGTIDLTGIHWVIVGGESGHGARPMEASWVHNILRQCRSANLPFFFKQWGGVRKSVAGRSLDGKTFDEMPKRKVAKPASPKRRAELIQIVNTWKPSEDCQPEAVDQPVLF